VGISAGPNTGAELMRFYMEKRKIEELKLEVLELRKELEKVGVCHCVTVQQDQTCPVGYPSLLCDDCGGIGNKKSPGPQISGGG